MARPTTYASEVSVPLPTDDEVKAVIGDAMDVDEALNVMKMMTGAGNMFPALVGMVQAVFGEADIDASHREIIVLRAASVLNCPYEWQANERMARNAGLTETDIAAAAGEVDPDAVAPEYRLLLAATDELLIDGTLTDLTLRELLDVFGATVTRKYVVTIAWFSLLSLFLNGTRVPLESTDKIGSRTSPIPG